MHKRKVNTVTPAKAGAWKKIKSQTPAFVGVTALLLSFAAPAAEPVPSTYRPDYCEFAVTFPAEPYTSRRCDSENEKTCYDLVSFTKVFDLDATVNFRVICNPVNAEIYSHYTGEVMELTLKAMTKRSVVQTFDTSFREEEGYKQAGLVGEGHAGTQSTVYIAQLWIGRGSALSVEAEMIGGPTDASDKLFSDVLQSVHFVTEEEKKPPEEKEKTKQKKKEK